MRFERLLAKSQKKYEAWIDSMWLPVHLGDVHRAAEQVLLATGDDQLQALGLSPQGYRQRFRRIVLLAAACHDLGKANDHFQGMIHNSPERREKPQGLRHEWITLLMLQEAELRSWLLPAVAGDDNDWQLMLWAIVGHHPAYNRPSPPTLFVDGAGHEIELLMGHDDFKECLTWLSHAFKLSDVPRTESRKWRLVRAGNVFATRVMPWFMQASVKWGQTKEPERRLVAAIKSCLIAADVAGSALPRQVKEDDRQTWIADSFARRPSPDNLSEIITDRLTDEDTGRVAELHPFQREVADKAAEVTFVRAGCGSGKTLAAYHWARQRHANRRLYFCYPTTGTATEGFRDYLLSGEKPKFHAQLFHGRRDIDYEMLGVHLPAEDDDAAKDEADSIARIESLDAWSTPIVTCTVDTVLGLLQNNRRGLYAWPALVGAAFVFDEIHAYDDKLFGALLRFLEGVPGLPVLLMTASLPTSRMAAIQGVMKRRKVQMSILPSAPLESESWLRYQRHGKVEVRDPLPEIQRQLEEGGKVLWVCNVVDRAMNSWDRACDTPEITKRAKPLIYHSRFRYEDRVDRHKAVIDAFKEPGPALAICTQVAEMSLDLSAGLLVTELAPVPPMIQRMGRLNRRAKRGDPPRSFIVIDVGEDHLPYTPAQLEMARTWLDSVGDQPLSQRHLSNCWEKLDADSQPAFVSTAWLDGGPATHVLPLREASQGITVLLDEDAEDVREGRLHPARAALPMPAPRKPWKDQWRKWRQVKGLPAAPAQAIEYRPERGAKWR